MKTKTFFPPQWRSTIGKLLFLFIFSLSLALTSCEKAKDVVQPSETELKASQAQEARKDDDYKRNKTGQYVSKDVQVTGYEDGSERPTRPKFDAADAITSLTLLPGEPCEGCVTYIPPTFISSEGMGGCLVETPMVIFTHCDWLLVAPRPFNLQKVIQNSMQILIKAQGVNISI